MNFGVSKMFRGSTFRFSPAAPRGSRLRLSDQFILRLDSQKHQWTVVEVPVPVLQIQKWVLTQITVCEHVCESTQDQKTPGRYSLRNCVFSSFGDALAEPTRPTATGSLCTLSLPNLLCSSLRPVVPLKEPSKSTLAHDAVAVALSHKHHLIIHVGTGPIQLIYCSPLQLAAGRYSETILFSTIFWREFSNFLHDMQFSRILKRSK